MGGTPVMVEYDFLELLKAIRVCVNKPRYRVGIFTTTMRRGEQIAHEAFNSIRDDIVEVAMLDRMRLSSSEQIITFENGSYIKFVRANDNARGYKLHHILYDKDISEDIKHTIIRPLQIRYMER